MTWPLDEESQPGEFCIEELRKSKFNAFVAEDRDTQVTIFESTEIDAPFTKNVFNDVGALKAHLLPAKQPKIRVLSISQDDSYEPLNMTKAGMEHIIRSLQVSSDFVTILSSMGSPPHEAEFGSGHVTENHYEDGSFDISYLFRYYGYREWQEEDLAEPRRSWKLRQIGVYHSFNASKETHTFVLIHPGLGGPFQESLDQLEGCKQKAENLHARPMTIHALLFSSHFQNWRLFLQEKGNRFREDSENLLAQDMKDLQLDVRFDRLQFWHDLKDRIAPLEAIFTALLNQLHTLQRIDTFLTTVRVNCSAPNNTTCFKVLPAAYFNSRENLVRGLMVSLENLQKRIHATSRLLESTLELRNQEELSSINKNVYRLQRESLDDSETVKVITILTMIYLPASLVSSLFGMNFFDFNEGSGRLITASNWWVYPAFFVPLTIITIVTLKSAVWILRWRKQVKADKAKDG